MTVDNSTWADTVISNFEIKYWPFTRSNQTKTCVNVVMNESPANLFKLKASRLLAGGLAAVVTLYSIVA